MKFSTFLLFMAGFACIFFFKNYTRKLEAERRKKQRKSKGIQRNYSSWLPPREENRRSEPSFLEKGEQAERNLELALKRRLPKKHWHVFRNVTLKRNDEDGTTQIDLIVLSVFGVFAIEVKNIKGHIYANKGPTWFVYPYPGSEKISMQNPHAQNHAHVKAIEQTLRPLKVDGIKSIVALLGNGKYKGLPDDTYIETESLIAALEARTEKIISVSQMAIAIGLIEYARHYDLPETDQAHVEYLQKKHEKTTDQNKQNACNN